MRNTRLKYISFIICLVFFCLNLSGCSNYVINDLLDKKFTKAMIEIIEGEQWESASERLEKEHAQIRESTDENEPVITEEKTKEPEKEESKKEDKTTKKEDNKKDEADDNKDDYIDGTNYSAKRLEEIRKEIDDEDNYNYYYHQLTLNDKDLYAQIYSIISDLKINEKLITKDVNKVDEIFLDVVNDHPELFYIKGYSMNKYMVGNNIDSLEFSGTYTKNKDEISNCLNQIYDYESECLALMQGGDDYSKIKYVYEYIIKNTEYDLNSPENQNILSVFVNGKSVCQGYAKATQYLLDRLGIPCILVSGTVSSGESHAWNVVKADGKWYYLDTTWGDASYSGGKDVLIPDVSYDFLCTNSYWMDKTHHVKTKYALPECNSLDDFYFVKEGTYFTWYDEAKLRNLIVEYTNRGEEVLTIKCEGAECYHEFVHELIDNNKIADLFYGKTDIRYSRMDDLFNFSFYLD